MQPAFLSSFGKNFAKLFIAVHFVYFILDLFWGIAFLNHFSHPQSMLDGLWSLGGAFLHLACLLLGLILRLGVKERDRGLLGAWLIGLSALTLSSLLYLIVYAVIWRLSLFQLLAWVLHLLFYFGVLLLSCQLRQVTPPPPIRREEDLEEGLQGGGVRVEGGPPTAQGWSIVDKVATGATREISEGWQGFLSSLKGSSPSNASTKNPNKVNNLSRDSDESD